MSDTFKITFAENYLQKDDAIDFGKNEPLKIAPWYLRWLGFNIIYRVIITSDPVQVGEYYQYTTEIIRIELHWLYWKIYTFKKK